MSSHRRGVIDGKNLLRYDGEVGIFQLLSVVYAIINCPMEFRLYPFDTQTCQFVVSTEKNIDHQVYH